MNGSSIRRVQYFERQYLRTQDFTDEQAYHVAMRRRHNIAHHSWGIVYGLQLEYDTAASVFIVHPGMAIDGYGRELILAKNYDILVNEFALRDRSTLDVWLRYERKAVSPAPSGYGASGRHGETPHYRWQELAIVTLTPAAFDSDRRKPEGVAAGDLDFSPNRMPPDEPTLEWPVYLGQIRRDLADAENPYKVDLRGRPYAGLVGEAIRAPSGRALVQLGTDPAAGQPFARRRGDAKSSR